MFIKAQELIQNSGKKHSLFTEIYSKWINDPNVVAKAIKPLEENKGVNHHNLWFGKEFLGMTLKS